MSIPIRSNDPPSLSIEKDTIHSIILYRSLYILKRKFELHKSSINSLYAKYNTNKTLTLLPIDKLISILSSIMSNCEFAVVPYGNITEVFTADLIAMVDPSKTAMMTAQIVNYMIANVEKYNMIFYNKKMNAIRLKREMNKKKNDVLIEKKITLYDKRGKIIVSSDDMKANNKELSLKSPAYEINEEDVAVLYSKRFLYSETIPLIIADFVTNNDSVAIVDVNGEFAEETKSMFDNEIISKVNEIAKVDVEQETEMKVKNMLYEEMNIDKTINVYENIIVEKVSKGDNNIGYLQKMINKLKAMKSSIKGKINTIGNTSLNASSMLNAMSTSHIDNSTINNSKISKRSTSKASLRKNALHDIFYFYSHQHNLVGASPTFDSVKEMKENLDLGEFTKFCVEFSIKVNKAKLVEIFKKTAKNSRNMSYDEFVIALQKIAVEVNEEKKRYLEGKVKEGEKEIRDVEKKIKRLEEKQKKEEEMIMKQEKETNLDNAIKEENEEENVEIDKKEEIESQNEDNKSISSNLKSLKGDDTKSMKSDNKSIITKSVKNEDTKSVKSNNTKSNNEDTKSIKSNNTKSKIEDNKSVKSKKSIDTKTIKSSKKEEDTKSVKSNSTQNQNQRPNNITILPNDNKYDNASSITKEDDISSHHISISPSSHCPDQFSTGPLSSPPHLSHPLPPKPKSVKFSLQYQTTLREYTERKTEIQSQLINLRSDYTKLCNKSYPQLQEELYQHIQIDNAKQYKSKMNGFIPLKVKPIQITQSNTLKSSDVVALLIQRRDERETQRRLKEENDKRILFEAKKKKLKEKTDAVMRNAEKKMKKPRYVVKAVEKNDYNKGKTNTVSWNELNNMDYDAFILDANKGDEVNRYMFNENSEDDSEEELLQHLHLKEKMVNSVSNIERESSGKKKVKRVKINIDSFEEVPSNQRRTKNVMTTSSNSNRVTISAKKILPEPTVITKNDISKKLKQKEDTLLKQFTMGTKTKEEINDMKTVNVIKKFEKKRNYNKY